MTQNKEKGLKRLVRNWGLKIVSFLFAVTLWLVVVNIEDPTIKWTYTDIPVTIKNAEVITEQGMIYEILENTNVVPRVTVYAPRSTIEKLTKADIVATADMNTLNSLNMLTIEYSVPRAGTTISDIRGSIDSVKVSIENKKNIQLVLKTNVTGGAPEGYMVGNVTTDQNLVRVSGPESVVNRVDSAVVNIDMSTLSAFTSDITTSAPVRLYDAEGNEVEGSTLVSTPENVMITIEILSTKEVPLRFGVSGEPAEGYGLTGVVNATPGTVQIAGRKSVLNNIAEIQIPPEAIDATGITQNMITQVDVRNYLPENVTLADKSFDGMVSVLIEVESEVAEEYTLEAAKIRVENLPGELEYSIEDIDEEYTVSVRGIGSVMETITEENLSAYIDVAAWMQEQEMTELNPGRYKIELSFNMPEHAKSEVPVYATLVVGGEAEE